MSSSPSAQSIWGKKRRRSRENGKFNVFKILKILANWWFIFMFLCPQEGVEGQYQNPFQHFSCVSHSTNNQPTLQHFTLRKHVELWLTGKKASPSHGCWEECGWWGPSGLQQNLSEGYCFADAFYKSGRFVLKNFKFTFHTTINR